MAKEQVVVFHIMRSTKKGWEKITNPSNSALLILMRNKQISFTKNRRITGKNTKKSGK